MADSPDDADNLDDSAPEDVRLPAMPEFEAQSAGDAVGLGMSEEGDLESEYGLKPFRWKVFAAAVGLLAVLLGFHAFGLSQWISRDGRPPSWDQSIQLEIAKDFQNAARSGHWGAIMHPRPKPGMPPFPPLHHALVQYAMDDPDPAESALWINWFYIAILCVSLFGLGRKAGGEWGGLAAAVLISCMPEVQWLLRDQIIDLALTAWVAAAYWALLESDRFERRIPAILFAVLFSAAMLTKWSAFTYFIPVLGMIPGALKERGPSQNLKIAAAAFAVLIGPWYLIQWPVLIPRLVAASSDNAVSVFSVNGMLGYVRQMPLGMEFPFFAAAMVALTRRQKTAKAREAAALMMWWFAAAFIFWTIVPNRQLRYLLPALAPLAVLTAFSFNKKILAGLCAFQIFAAANYAHAWVGHRNPSFAGFGASIFRSQLPKEEDWKIQDILRRVEELHDPSAPFGNVALLANAVHFNGAIFNWELVRLGIETVKMRGINRRICEFAEFLLTKTGKLGPKSVVNQLPGVRTKILSRGSWFLRGYQEVARWPLPDKSEAVLYQRRKPTRVPLLEGRSHIDYVKEKTYTIENARIDFGRWDSRRGVYPKVRIRVDKLIIRGLEIRGLVVDMEDLFVVSVEDPSGVSNKMRDSLLMDLRLLRMKKLTLVSGTIGAASLAVFIEDRVKGVGSVKARIDDTLAVSARFKGVPIAAEASLKLVDGGRALEIELMRLSVLGIPFPTFLLGPNRRYRKDFAPDPEMPFEISIPGLKLSGGYLRIGK